jgi:hypothetical protein
MIRFNPKTTKVLFFDLEFFTPPKDRERITPGSMKFSPVRPGHKIIGGVFQTYYPMLDKLDDPIAIWEWKLGSERAVLKKIQSILHKEWYCFEKYPPLGSLILCGIGIARSDLPALYARMTALSINRPERLYHLLFGGQLIDLTISTLCQFNFNYPYFAYPKPKAELYQKYLNGKKIEPGLKVLDFYDRSAFDEIESRTLEEVKDMIAIYKAMFDRNHKVGADLRRLKKIDKEKLADVACAVDGQDAVQEPSAESSNLI